MKKLLIVESPAKAKTIEKILGRNYKVVASYGHVRDLPKTKLGVEVEKNFEPQYIVPIKAKKVVAQLKKEFKSVGEVYLATDLDREGEAIAWHIVNAVKPPKKTIIRRVVFPAIIKSAVETGMAEAREIDMHLVDAQQARRVLDRLVGYKLSPLLWKKIFRGLSAGRVQSVALRLVVEREREIEKFKPEEYWTIEADFGRDEAIFHGVLKEYNLKEFAVDNKSEADRITELAKRASYVIGKIETKDSKRYPLAPFTTSTLQQEAFKKLHFSAKKTMTLAQKLYEGVAIDDKSVGLITYMRTDSTNISAEGITQIRDCIKSEFGAEELPATPVVYKKKSKLAQEAHEAVRVTYPDQLPDKIKSDLEKDMWRLYELIWKRTVASQMLPAEFKNTIVTVDGSCAEEKVRFEARGIKMLKTGFLKVWDYSLKNKEDVILPDLQENDPTELKELFTQQHFTQPPARYTEASLVKELEKNGVGRPSTYASIMSTIVTRAYVEKFENKFKPLEVGFLVNDFLVKYFPDIVDVKFTAGMEEKLDNVALGEQDWVSLMREFYEPFAANLADKEKKITKKDITGEKQVDEKCPECGKNLMEKMSRYGKFLACSGFPDCKFTRPLGVSKEEETTVKEAEPCEKCGGKMVLKKSRFGSFLACSNYPNCKNVRNLQGIKLPCPICKKGNVVSKRTRRGKVFWGCDNYPECKTAYWNEPVKDVCPECGYNLTRNKKGEELCEKCKKSTKK